MKNGYIKLSQNELMMFDELQIQRSEFILRNPNSKLSGLNSNDLRKLAVAWSYYSGKIEGNTYTYVETEALLIDGIASPKRYEDAKMLKNLHNTFTGILSDVRAGKLIPINEVTVSSFHSSLMADLIDDHEKGRLRTRPVKISGTSYTPPKAIKEIRQTLNEIFSGLNKYSNSLERAIYGHCNLAMIQPFIDGNKRTARLIESIVLLENDLIPIYSTKDKDILEYRNALVKFYETKNYTQYSNYFLDKHLERINKVSLKNEPYWQFEKKEEPK